ncbi:MAG: TRAP transporter small permease subunit [Planctomycetota bacterium]
MQALATLLRPVHQLNRRLAGLAAVCTLLMVLIGAYNALARFTGKYLGLALTSNALVELQWYLFSLVFLLGAPYALHLGAHVRVDVLYERLSPRARAWIDLLGTLFLLLPFCALGIWASWHFTADSIAAGERSNDPGGLLRWPIKLMVPIAFALLFLQGLAELARHGSVILGRPLPDEPGEDPHFG